MNQDDFNKLKTSLNYLTQDQLSQVATLTAYLKEMKSSDDLPSQVDFQRQFYEEFKSIVGKKLLIQLTPYPIFKKHPTLYKTFTHAYETVERFLDGLGGGLTRTQRVRAYFVICGCVVEDLINAKMHLTLMSVIRHFHSLPTIMQGSFPDYSDQMLLRWVFRTTGAKTMHAKSFGVLPTLK